MKSIGLASTIFALTVTLATLDLSGGHEAKPTWFATAQKANMSSSLTVATATKAAQDKLDGDDDADEGDGEVVRTFLVTPRQLPVATSKVTELRYD